MGNEELDVFYEFNGRNICVAIFNKTNNDITIPHVQLLEYQSNNWISEFNNVVVKGMKENDDLIFKNIPNLLSLHNMKPVDSLIVRCITSEGKHYDTIHDSYGREL